MFPTLGHLLSYLTGNEIVLGFPTFGLMVALAFIAAAAVLTSEMKRKEKIGLFNPIKEKITEGEQPGVRDLLSNGIFGFLVGFKTVFVIQHLDAFLRMPSDVLVSPEGNIPGGIIGALLFAGWAWYQKKQQALPKPVTKEVEVHPYELVPTITLIAALFGILGAKIFHNLEYFEEFLQDPIGAITSFSGLTFYGGLIFGAAGVIYYTKKRGMNPLSVADSVAPGLILAYAVGRIGCQLSGDGDWGIVNNHAKPGFLSLLPDWMWAFTFPHNVAEEGIPIAGCVGQYCQVLPEPVYPTALYETMMGLVIFGILWSMRKKIDMPGLMFSVYLLFNGIERLLIEQIRVNVEVAGSFTQAEIIALVLIGLGALGMGYFFKKRKEERRIKG
jgi:prolipoprotein diacylglyceryltransferase